MPLFGMPLHYLCETPDERKMQLYQNKFDGYDKYSVQLFRPPGIKSVATKSVAL